MMQFSAAQIAALLEGKVEGNPEATVSTFGKIEIAKDGELSFLANPKYEEFLYSTEASVVIVNNDLILREAVKATLVRVPNAYAAFAKLLELYASMRSAALVGIDTKAVVPAATQMGKDVYIGPYAVLANNIRIGDNVKIYPGAYIGDNVKIGNNVVINANVAIYFDCQLGDNVIIHSGAIIGADGFGFAPNPDGSFSKIPQIGNVIIEDNVEVGANATIDRATIGSTILRKGAKIDNLVQIAHNVSIGDNTVIAAQAGISGSTKIGKNVMIGGQAGIVGHIQLADFSKVNAQSGVTKSLSKPKSSVTGSPADNYLSSLRSQALVRELPALEKRIKELEDTFSQLLIDKK